VQWVLTALIVSGYGFFIKTTFVPTKINVFHRFTELQRAIDWLTLQRGKDWGWGTGTDTAQAIVAMEMTKTGGRLERELSAKQLEIELLARLWQHHDPDSVTLQQQDDEDEALTVANIATYSMALASACHDPRQFHGHDLIGKSYKKKLQ